ncbi:hypothetical protein [Oceanicoccus sagamiensis]|uniref:VanZ-like domain-containing protein n=1 Tax=Oceanicoccus sagamiensis TaxID=716816 RepID=A0A1X9N8G6_9GAMM|nr:hypothetical protein [Oceanicoccus sagamiensis]ARN74350.1 hypothetical protein BST96_09570 [Oceanicoccus sagamiensis]
MKLSNQLLPLALLLILPWFFWGGPGYYDFRSYKFLWNFGHIIFFALLSFWLLKRLSERSGVLQISLVILVTAILGIAIEWIQNGIGRQLDLYDLGRNFLGAAIALCWWSPLIQTSQRSLLWISRTIAIGLVLSQLLILSSIILDEWRVNRGQPVLSQFDTSLEISRWKTNDKAVLVSSPVKEGQYALQVKLGTEQYSGVSLDYFFRDWRDYQALRLSIFNPDDSELAIVIRINDQRHLQAEQAYSDRFNRNIILQPGWNSVVFSVDVIEDEPEGRAMDITAIESIGIFTVALSEPKILTIDSVRLLKTSP